MQTTRTLVAAQSAIEAAGYRFDARRSFSEFDADGRERGMAFSVESDRACFGHPMMEIVVDGDHCPQCGDFFPPIARTVHACPKIPQGYGVDPGDCACGNCPEAR